MAWIKDHTDATNIYWRREEDGYVIGFNREGVGVPFSREDAPPADIDKYAEPMNAELAKTSELALLKAKLATLETDIADLKKGRP